MQRSEAHDTGTSCAFICFGRRWSVETDDPDLLSLLKELFRPHLSTASGPLDVRYRFVGPDELGKSQLLLDDEIFRRNLPPAGLLSAFLWSVNQLVIGAGDHQLCLHAAAAADTGSKVVLMPAPMESGKTTLVTGLLDRGMAYLTDEAALVTGDGTVHGFAKPLSLDPGSWHLFPHHTPRLPPDQHDLMVRQWQVPAHRFATVVPSGRLAAIVFPTYSPSAALEMQELDPITALDLARATTFGPPGLPLSGDRIAELAELVQRIPAYRMLSGDLDAACDAVLHLLEDVAA